jgi:starch phosphorylase
MTTDELLALGRAPGAADVEPFRPTFLAVRGSARVNAVSALHADTSRELFGPLFPRWPRAEVPIHHVTNGVHVPSWDSAATDELWTNLCGHGRWRGSVERLEQTAGEVDDRTLWTVRARARRELVEQARRRLAHQLARRGGSPESTDVASRVLDPDVLTLGLARRFAEYKRPNLLLRDEQRLRRLLNDRLRPVQLLVAGKAHPEDRQGKALLEAWMRFVTSAEVRARCVFLEDYDLTLAQELVQGADVWISTPRRPWEACGTSGMKVLVNGGLNVSVLDGWWAEAYAPDVGWAIGDPRAPSDDARDAESLFQILEQEIVPAFYDRDAEGLPRAWLARVRASLARLTPQFSANRMLHDYVAGFYRPAEAELAARLADGGSSARDLEGWARRVSKAWPGIRFGTLDVRASDHGPQITVETFLNEADVSDVRVELYADPAAPAHEPARIPMESSGPLPGTSHGFLFKATVPDDRPTTDWTPRVIPASHSLHLPGELGLITWYR